MMLIICAMCSLSHTPHTPRTPLPLSHIPHYTYFSPLRISTPLPPSLPPSRLSVATQSNESLHPLVSRAREGVFTDWFVRHCGGWNEIACMKAGMYDRQMVHAGMGSAAAQRREWAKLAAASRIEMYGTMEREFGALLKAKAFDTKGGSKRG